MILRSGMFDDNVYDRSVVKRLQKVWKPVAEGCYADHDAAVRTQESAMQAVRISEQAAAMQDAAAAGRVPVIRSCRMAVCTECLPGGGTLSAMSAQLALTGAVNELAAKGLQAETVQVSLLLPEGGEEALLRTITDAISTTAAAANVTVTGFHGMVTAAAERPIITISAMGGESLFGLKGGESRGLKDDEAQSCSAGESVDHRKEDSGEKDSRENDDAPPDEILAIGHIAMEGTAVLTRARRTELEKRFPMQMLGRSEELLDHLNLLPAIRTMADLGIRPRRMVAASDGGIYAALWELARVCGSGFTVELPEIPILQETIEITDYLGVNPYQMQSKGLALAVTANAEEAAEMLMDHGVYAKPIGWMTAGRDKVITNGDEHQNLNRPEPDAVICCLDGKEE